MFSRARCFVISPVDPPALRSCLRWSLQDVTGSVQLAAPAGSFSIWQPAAVFIAFTKIAGGIVGEKRGFIFSPSLFFLCNLLPSETINAHSTSTSRRGFDVYSGSRPLSFSAACCSSRLPSSLYPPLLSLPLPSARSQRLLYNQIIKGICSENDFTWQLNMQKPASGRAEAGD